MFTCLYTQNNFSGSLSFVIRTKTDAAAATALVRTAVRAIDRSLAIYNVRTFDDIVSASIATERFSTTLLGAFAIAALLLAAVGIYGVTDQAVSQRTHEIGVRLALGASPHQVLALVLGDGLRLCAIGIVLGVAGALALARVLSGLLFGVSALDPRAYIAVSVVLGLASLTACYLPARRATMVEPTVALRAE